MTLFDVAVIAAIMFILLMMGFPMMVPLIAGAILTIIFYIPGVTLTEVLIPQTLRGVAPLALVCIPLFIFAADVTCRGRSAKRLVDFVKAWVGHIPAGLAISASLGATLFGSVSGSAQATVVAIGMPLRPPLLEAKYPQSFVHAVITSSAGIALLIPPSITAIIYGVSAKASIGALFLSGVGSGLLVFVLFAIYEFFYSRLKHVGTSPKASWSERLSATRSALLTFGFPVIIIGGIFSGIFSPTESAGIAVVYALLLEGVIYRDIGFKDIIESALSTGVMTGVIFILIGFGQALSFVVSYARVPDLIVPVLLGHEPSSMRFIIVVMATYFIACMFIDVIVAIYVLTPIFYPFMVQLGVDPVFLGALVILQSAIGVTTPPFGATLFTETAVFRRPYLEVIRGVPPFIAIMLVANVLIVAFPNIVMWLPNMSLGK